MKSNTDVTFWRELKVSRPILTKQQYRTIKGQAVKGNVMAARKVCRESNKGGSTDENNNGFSACRYYKADPICK